jgi:hypothetical protein
MFLRSKKTSESGVWVNDEDVDTCFCCAVKFSFSIRKHHCRVGPSYLFRSVAVSDHPHSLCAELWPSRL